MLVARTCNLLRESLVGVVELLERFNTRPIPLFSFDLEIGFVQTAEASTLHQETIALLAREEELLVTTHQQAFQQPLVVVVVVGGMLGARTYLDLTDVEIDTDPRQ